MTDYCIGIDLGTTYSCLAYVDEDGDPVIEKNFEQEETTPSVILFDDNGQILVGSQAKEMALMYEPDRTVTAIKRKIGSSYEKEIDGKVYNPTQLSATILKKLLDDFNSNHCCEVKKAVITVPAYFGQNERDQTKTAGRIAGLEEVTLINEPTAAAISYGYSGNREGKERVLVYDLGGGTFDVTVLEIEDGKFNAVATDGERFLGGKDWDAAMSEIIKEKVSEESGTDIDFLESDPEVVKSLEYDSEVIKKRLSTSGVTKGTLTVDGHKYVYSVNRNEFEDMSEDKLLQTLDVMDRVLKSKSMTIDDIDVVILVGGSSRMPQVKEAIMKKYPTANVKAHDADLAVAKGAALFAKSMADSPAAITEGEVAAAAEAIQEEEERRIIVKNVLSKTFGLKATYEDGTEMISNIIFRNETLPIEKTKRYYPVEQEQNSIRIEIFEDAAMNDEEGTKTDMSLGVAIGEFTMDLPENVDKETPIDVTFVATEEGILTASVTCMDQHKEYTLENDLKMTLEEIEKSQSIMERVVTGC